MGRNVFFLQRCRANYRVIILMLFLMFLQSIPAFALPFGERIITNNGSVSRDGKGMQINQSSDKMIINWKSFSIAKDEKVHFNQKPTDIALNRVIGSDPSSIFGNLSADGRMFLVNSNGILFGPSSQVNVGGIVASTLDISNTDFLNSTGKYSFTKGIVDGSVINQGEIASNADKGYVALLGPKVINEGIIRANLGSVVLGGGNRVTLDMTGDGLLKFAVDGRALDAHIANKGIIHADSGRVIMSAGTGNDLIRSVVNNEGIIRAGSMVERNGRIYLEGGTVNNSGTLDVSGRNDGAAGGSIKLLGHKVNVTGNAVLDASGDTGGGEILIGGNYQGKGPEPNSKETFIGGNVNINADAITRGKGGKVIAWSDDVTIFNGKVSAQGGAKGGAGGFVETSGHTLKIGQNAFVDTRAPKGKTGSWLLDPNDFTIAAGGGDATGTQVAGWLGTSDVTIQTATMGHAGGNGDIFVNDNVRWANGNSLTLLAERDININAKIGSTSGGGKLNLRADANASFLSNSTGYIPTVRVNADGYIDSSGIASIYYNPTSGTYATPNTYKNMGIGALTAYLLVNDVGAPTSSRGLQAIIFNLAGNYALGKGIDAGDTRNWNSGAGFKAIGDSETNRFTGSFDGLGHTITGLFMNEPTMDNFGLFGSTSAGSSIRNVGLENINVRGQNAVGGLAGLNSGTIENSYSTGAVSGSTSVGGLAGVNSGTISNSYSEGAVSGSTTVGGLAGYNTGTILNSYSSAYISGTDRGAGGLVGVNESDSTISNSYSTGNVSGNSEVGGLVGVNWDIGSISGSYSTGAVSGSNTVGGLVGWNVGTISNSYSTAFVSGTYGFTGGLVGDNVRGSISNSYSTGTVSGNTYVGGLAGRNKEGGSISGSYSTGAVSGSNYVGGFVGENYSAISNSYWDTQTSGRSAGCGGGSCTGATGLTTAQMMQRANLSGFLISTMSGICRTVFRAIPVHSFVPNTQPISATPISCS